MGGNKDPFRFDGTKVCEMPRSHGKTTFSSSTRFRPMTTYGPGTGKYATDKNRVLRQAPRTPMPGDRRFWKAGAGGPGPAAYNTAVSSLKLSEHGERTIGQEQRFRGHTDQAGPGPGKYHDNQTDLRSWERAPFTGDSRFKSKGDPTPGPDAYECVISSLRKNGYGTRTIGKEDRFLGHTDQAGPGPGKYHDNKPDLRSTERAPFSGDSRFKSKGDPTPGPDAYDNAVSSLRKNDYGTRTFGQDKRFRGSTDKTGPGPGKYLDTQPDMKASGNAPFTNDSRFKSKGQPTPGPDAYDNVISSLRKNDYGTRTIGKEERFRGTTDEAGPGTGKYQDNQPDMRRPATVAQTQDTRFKPSNSGNTPGPAAYDNSVSSLKKSEFGTRTIGTCRRFDKQEVYGPGTGKYLTDGRPVMRKPGNAAFPNAQRFQKKESGPASRHYNVHWSVFGYDFIGAGDP